MSPIRSWKMAVMALWYVAPAFFRGKLCKRKSPLRDKGGLRLILFCELDPIVTWEHPVHERQPLMPGRWINQDINDWEREVVFWTSLVEISKVDAHTNAAVFLCHRDYIGNPVWVIHCANETSLRKLGYFLFDRMLNVRMEWLKNNFTGFAPYLRMRRCSTRAGSSPSISS